MITIDIVLSVCALMHSIDIVHFHCKPIGNADDPKKLRNRGDAGFVTRTCYYLMTGKGLKKHVLKSTSNEEGLKGDNTHTLLPLVPHFLIVISYTGFFVQGNAIGRLRHILHRVPDNAGNGDRRRHGCR